MLNRVITFLKGRVSVLIETGATSKAMHLALPKWLLYALLVVVVSLVGHGGGTMLGWISDQTRSYKLKQLEHARDELLEEYAHLEQEADSLKQILALLETHDIQLRIYKGMEILSADVRALGMGGPAQESAELTKLRRMESPYYEKAAELDRSLANLLHKARFQEESFAEIDKRITRDQKLRDHTPSVRPTRGRLTSGYGYRIDPFLHIPKMHTGVDISNQPGTPILASAEGVVTFTGWLSGYGKTVKINHGNGIQTLYGHLDKFLVKKGQKVLRDEVIATMGNTGRSTGPHLHYEVRVAGKPVNPYGYFLDEAG